MEQIKKSITSVMPSITAQLLEELSTALIEVGVETTADLIHVQEQDLAPYLKPIQSRKLINAWSINGKFKIRPHFFLFIGSQVYFLRFIADGWKNKFYFIL